MADEIFTVAQTAQYLQVWEIALLELKNPRLTII